MNTNEITSFEQFKIQFSKYSKIMLRDKKNLIVSLLFPVAAVFITIFIAGENMFINYESTKSGCFVIVCAAIWGGLFNSIQTVVKERSRIKRDYMDGMKFRSYILSHALVQLILCMIQSLILTTSFIGIELKFGNEIPDSGIIFGATLLEYYISIFLLMYSADALGLMISCIVKKSETANVLSPYLLIVQLIFSGVLFDLKNVFDALSYTMISRWGMETLGSISNLNDLPLKIQETVPTVPHEIESMFKYSKGHLCISWIILLVFSILFIIVGNFLLHRVQNDTRSN